MTTSAGDHEPLGRGQVDGTPGKCLLGKALAIPERAVAESLHLAHELALDRSRLAVERPGEHADAAGIDAVESRQAHGRPESTLVPAAPAPRGPVGSTRVPGW